MKLRYEKGDRAVFECGCVTDIVGGAFVIEPCSPTCDVYAYVVEETRRQRKPIELMEKPS